MSNETIVAVYDTAAHAEAAVASLKSAGLPASAINVHSDAAGTATSMTAVAPPREHGFWSSLFGGEPDHDTAVYDRSMAGGSVVVSVDAPAEHVAKVLDILERHDPIDMDDRAASYGLTQTAASKPVAATAPGRTDAGDALQLSEETLAVGKRVVNRGGTRIRRFVVETPVEESVALHSEKVVLERHPVTDGRAPSDSFTDKSIEMTEMAEEAVVSKNARVYEEIGLRKEVNDRVETVRDTVRKEDVEVVQVPGSPTTSTVVPVATKTAGTTDKVSHKV
ncbi:MAG: DUF2382 domain-containing protein [Alphaproteobacteria bacterium]|nr:MAG: DUF2382 domain-containing protein [Alphaproteobacteria bacterium]